MIEVAVRFPVAHRVSPSQTVIVFSSRCSPPALRRFSMALAAANSSGSIGHSHHKWELRVKRLQGADRGGAARFNAQFFEHLLDMLFHGGLRDAEDRRDVRVRLALGEPE